MDITYTIGGVDLHDPTVGRYVMRDTTLPTVGQPRTAITEVPSRYGSLLSTLGTVGASTVTVSLMVVGDTYAQVVERWSDTLRLLRLGDRVSLTRVLGGVTYTASAAVSSVSEPTFNPRERLIEALVVFTIPGALWYGTPVTVTADDTSALDGSGGPLRVDEIRVAMTDSTLRITDRVTGLILTWDGDYRSGHTLVIHPETYTADWDDSTPATAGLSLPTGGWRITPGGDGTVGVTVFGPSASAVTITAARSVY